MNTPSAPAAMPAGPSVSRSQCLSCLRRPTASDGRSASQTVMHERRRRTAMRIWWIHSALRNAPPRKPKALRSICRTHSATTAATAAEAVALSACTISPAREGSSAFPSASA